ncbi:hypothetical protein Fcan01_21937 [Folsomia candida]|uniref:Uncharacterized protein n=1 Tax=Folsomia candida TaxID=158441 RepID=A0A226DEZ0_FOLCA|nr:hypothetical protein Fcan01_21937 [Folsomia candida]
MNPSSGVLVDSKKHSGYPGLKRQVVSVPCKMNTYLRRLEIPPGHYRRTAYRDERGWESLKSNHVVRVLISDNNLQTIIQHLVGEPSRLHYQQVNQHRSSRTKFLSLLTNGPFEIYHNTNNEKSGSVIPGPSKFRKKQNLHNILLDGNQPFDENEMKTCVNKLLHKASVEIYNIAEPNLIQLNYLNEIKIEEEIFKRITKSNSTYAVCPVMHKSIWFLLEINMGESKVQSIVPAYNDNDPILKESDLLVKALIKEVLTKSSPTWTELQKLQLKIRDQDANLSNVTAIMILRQLISKLETDNWVTSID